MSNKKKKQHNPKPSEAIGGFIDECPMSGKTMRVIDFGTDDKGLWVKAKAPGGLTWKISCQTEEV